MTPTLDRTSRALPSPPRTDHWPVAVRSADLRSGAFVRCGPGLRPVGWPETPRVRLCSLAPWIDGGWIPTHLTAAWVWGAAKSPSLPLQFTVPNGVRKPNYTTPDVLVRGLSIASHELEHFGGFLVTTPLRTICDLLRVRAKLETPEAVACRLLLRLVPNGRGAVADALESRRPHRAVAKKNFRSLAPGIDSPGPAI